MNSCSVPDVSLADVQAAIENNWFSMVYQPQVSIADTTCIVGAEAFVRLVHPDYGVLMPASFLGVVKDAGLMSDLTRLVIDQVAQDWSNWNKLGYDINVSVNLDESNLTEPGLGRALGKIISAYAVPKHKFTLEFAECWKDGSLKADVGKNLLSLRMKGFRLSIDDYGKEKIDDSVFADLPLDEIKVDRTVVNQLSSTSASQTTFKNAVHLANRYGLKLVAVGLEDEETLGHLSKLGCDVGQGYLIGKPVDQESFVKELIQSGKLQLHKESATKVFLLEDDPQFQNLLIQSLGDEYLLRVAGSLAEAKEAIKNFEPNIVLSDVNLPDGSGIEFCAQNFDQNHPKTPDIIFISGGSDFENKLQAYEAGGHDFIQKPFSMVELIAKLKQLANYQSRRYNLLARAEEANELVMKSLTETAYFGDIVQFLKNLMLCNDESSIAKELFRFMSDKQLFTCIEFRDGSTFSHFDQVAGVCSPALINVFELLRTKGRLYPFGNRMLVNDNHVSFIVKNMPDDDEDKGKVRDYVAVLVEGMEARYKEILRQRVMTGVTQKLESLATKLLGIVGDDQGSKNAALEKYSFELQMSFHTLDLTDDQEKHISGIIEEMLKSKDAGEQSAIAAREEVTSILDSIKVAMDDIDQEAQTQEEDNNGSGSSVDLF